MPCLDSVSWFTSNRTHTMKRTILFQHDPDLFYQFELLRFVAMFHQVICPLIIPLIVGAILVLQ